LFDKNFSLYILVTVLNRVAKTNLKKRVM